MLKRKNGWFAAHFVLDSRPPVTSRSSERQYYHVTSPNRSDNSTWTEQHVEKRGGDARTEGQRAHISGGTSEKSVKREENGGGKEATNVSTRTYK